MKKAAEIGVKIRKEMAVRNWSGQQLADAVGVTRQCINNIVLGKRVSKNTLSKIEEVLNLSDK